MRLACTVFEILCYFPKVKEVTWQWPRPFQGQFVVRRLGLAMINMHTKFDISTLRGFYVARERAKNYLMRHEMLSRSHEMLSRAHEIKKFACPYLRGTKYLNESRDMTTPISGTVCHLWAGTCYVQPTYQIVSVYEYLQQRYGRQRKTKNSFSTTLRGT